MRRALIVGHSIPSTFFHTSAVYLLKGQNKNKNQTEIDGNILNGYFWEQNP